MGVHGLVAGAGRQNGAGDDVGVVGASGQGHHQAVAHVLQRREGVHVVGAGREPGILRDELGVGAHAARGQNHGLAAHAQGLALGLGDHTHNLAVLNDKLGGRSLGEDVHTGVLHGRQQ